MNAPSPEPTDAAQAGHPDPAGACAAMLRPQALLDAMPDPWFVVDGDDCLLAVSREIPPLLTLPWDQARGRPAGDAVPAPAARLVAALARCRAGGGVETLEYRLASPGRSFEVRIVAMADGCCLCLTRDITASVQAQQVLRDSEARLTRAMRGTSDGLWDWDMRSGREYLSRRWKELMGLAPAAQDGLFARLHADDAGTVRASLHAHLQHGAPFDIELRLRTQGDEWRWCRLRGEVERAADGQPLRMAGVIADVTTRRQVEDALRDSQARFSAIFHTAPVGIALSALDSGTLLEINGELGRILGWPPGDLVGRKIGEIGLWPGLRRLAGYADRLRRAGHAALPELVLRHRDGHAVHVTLSSQCLQLGGGGRMLVLSAVTDISARVAAERGLREQREAYEAIFNAASDAIVSVDVQGRILIFNPGAERIFQRSAASLRGQSIALLLPSAQRAGQLAGIAGLAASPGSRPTMGMGPGRVKGLRADGQMLDLEASISRATVAGRAVLTAILRDVTEHVRAEADAQRHRSELSALTRQLLEQEKRTTQRLAQALHDRLGQTLTALRIALDRDRRAPATDRADADQRREQAAALVDQAIRQVRQVLVDLRPPLLDEEGLYAALDNELRSRATLHPAIDLLLEAPPAVQGQRWPVEVEYALFMIAREALDNALRHARPTLVRVELAGDAAGARLEVVDDGVGLAPGYDRAQPGHLGLIGMRERARGIGAGLAFTAAAEGGTCVSAAWPEPA